MPADVWFWNLRASRKAPYPKQMRKLLERATKDATPRKGALTAVKVHFGERGVTGFVSPLRLKPVVNFLLGAGARPFLTDTSTLYAGQRGDAQAHALTAAAHGFDPNVLNAPVIFADGLFSTHEAEVEVGGKYVRTAYLAADIVHAEGLVVVSHFKGHELAGYGGALKNVAMGCATKRGKMHQHGCVAPKTFADKCKSCGQCLEACAPSALTLDAEQRIGVDRELCAGCGACFQACAHGGIEVDWNTDVNEFLGRMYDYAAATLVCRAAPPLFVNFVVDVTPDCDCAGFSDAPLCADLGVAASLDPLALDQACLDLVAAAPPASGSKLPKDLPAGADKFRAVHGHVPENYGLDYAASLGLGSREYTLKRI